MLGKLNEIQIQELKLHIGVELLNMSKEGVKKRKLGIKKIVFKSHQRRNLK